MKDAKYFWPLFLFAFIQIGSAIFFLFPKTIVEATGFKTLPAELSVYQFCICALYFSVGVLFLLGAVDKNARRTALIIACVDALLEVVSYFAGLPQMGFPIWMTTIFSLCIAIPGVLCGIHLVRMHRNSANLMTNKEG